MADWNRWRAVGMPLEQFFREATHVILHHFTMKNQQCFTRVLLSPALPRDLGTAFCRIPPNLWRSLGLLVDDVLCISLSAEAERNDSSVVRNNRIGSTKRILCRARPLERSLTYGEENAHEITPLCYVDLFVTVPWNAPSDHGKRLIKSLPKRRKRNCVLNRLSCANCVSQINSCPVLGF